MNKERKYTQVFYITISLFIKYRIPTLIKRPTLKLVKTNFCKIRTYENILRNSQSQNQKLFIKNIMRRYIPNKLGLENITYQHFKCFVNNVQFTFIINTSILKFLNIFPLLITTKLTIFKISIILPENNLFNITSWNLLIFTAEAQMEIN